MFIKNKIVTSIIMFVLVSSKSIFASQPHIMDHSANFDSSGPAKKLHLILGTGASFSNESNISADPFLWDPPVQGYNATLDNSEFYTAGVGYQVSSLIDADIEVTYRPSFHYNKLQTPIPSPTTGVLGSKTRQFDLTNSSVMANVFLDGQGTNLFTKLNSLTTLQPFVGGGIGIAYNTLSNFHSVLASSSIAGTNGVASIMNSNSQTTFAWQISAGAELLYAETWRLDLGYRYFDGGRFKSNNYLFFNQVTVPPWSGRFTANEVFLNLNYFIAS